MAIDVMRNFYKGAALRSGLKDSGEAMGGNVMENFKTRQQAQQKFGSELAMDKAKKKNEMDLEMQTAEKYVGANGGKGGFVPKSFKIGSMTMENPQYQEDLMKNKYDAMVERKIQEKMQFGMQPDAAGRLESSLEGIRATRHMRKLLFPDNTPDSFQRQTAYKKSPFPFAKPVPTTEEARQLYRRAGQAIAGKLLVQSGVQTRESEYERLGEQHIANVFSNPKEAYDALNELETFYSGFVGNVDPKNMFHSPEEMEWNYTALGEGSGQSQQGKDIGQQGGRKVRSSSGVEYTVN